MTHDTTPTPAAPNTPATAPVACDAGAPCTTTKEVPTARPRMDAWATDEALHLHVDVPGVTPDAVELTGEGGRLTLRAGPPPAPSEDASVHREWRPVRFERTFDVTPDFDVAAAHARLEAGVLEIVVPRRAAARRRQIPVALGDA